MKTTVALLATFVILLFASSAGAASLRLTPAKVRPGALVTAVGTGFQGSRAGAITVGGRFVKSVRTGTGGSFTARFRVPRLALGPKGVAARVGTRRVVSSLVITRRTLSSTMMALSTGQRVLMSPARGVSGTTLRLSGSGFPNGRAVGIFYDGSPRVAVTTHLARGRGVFSTKFSVPATRGGNRPVTIRLGARVLMAIPFRARGCGVQVCLPYVADFSLNHGALRDKNGVGTGFTMVLPTTNGTGYVPANLTMATGGGGTLAITTTAGLLSGAAGSATPGDNAQDNALGVGMNAAARQLTLAATLVNVPLGTGQNEQAGLWFGKDENNYVKLVVRSSAGPSTQIQVLQETNGSTNGSDVDTVSVEGQDVALMLVTNPVTHTVQASYQVAGGAVVDLNSLAAPAGSFAASTFGGIFTSHRTASSPLSYSFGGFSVTGRAASGPGPGPTPGTWTTKTSLPIALEDAGGAELGGKLYVVGGKIDDPASTGSLHLRSLYVFDPAGNGGAGSWTQKADLPAAYAAGKDGVENPAVVAFNGKLYVFGGSDAAFTGTVADAAVYTPGSDSWAMLAPMSYVSGGVTVSGARTGAAAEALNGKIYVVGGIGPTNQQSIGTVLEYDTSTDTWARRHNLQTARDNPGSAVLDINGAAAGGERLFVFGGRTNPSNPTLNTVEMYDSVTNTWAFRANMPTGRRSLAVGTIGGKAQVMGGERTLSGGVFAQNQEYDPVANSWTTLAPMPTPRHGTAAGTIGGVVYVAGGGTTGGTSYSSVVEAFTLP